MVLVDDVERTKQLLAERAAQREIPAGASASASTEVPFYSPRRPPTTTTEQKAASPPQNPSKRLDELDAELALHDWERHLMRTAASGTDLADLTPRCTHRLWLSPPPPPPTQSAQASSSASTGKDRAPTPPPPDGASTHRIAPPSPRHVAVVASSAPSTPRGTHTTTVSTATTSTGTTTTVTRIIHGEEDLRRLQGDRRAFPAALRTHEGLQGDRSPRAAIDGADAGRVTTPIAPLWARPHIIPPTEQTVNIQRAIEQSKQTPQLPPTNATYRDKWSNQPERHNLYNPEPGFHERQRPKDTVVSHSTANLDWRRAPRSGARMGLNLPSPRAWTTASWMPSPRRPSPKPLNRHNARTRKSMVAGSDAAKMYPQPETRRASMSPRPKCAARLCSL